MADQLANNEEVGQLTYIYRGGRIPRRIRRRVTHVIVHRSVREIETHSFNHCPILTDVDFHDGVDRIALRAFAFCPQLRGVLRLPGVRYIGERAFYACFSISGLEFGDELDFIGSRSFQACSSIEHIHIPSGRIIGWMAFYDCISLPFIDFPEDLESIGFEAFGGCISLRRFGIPLKHNMFRWRNSFNACNSLATINVVGNTQRTVSLLSMDEWRNDMNEEIDRINQLLLEIDNDNQIIPEARGERKSKTISRWFRRTCGRLEYYKAMHKMVVNEGLAIIDLALWTANLQSHPLRREEERTRGRRKRARTERKVTSNAAVVLQNALQFLTLE